MDNFFKDDELFITKHHLKSFNEFTNETIPSVIKSLNPFSVIQSIENSSAKNTTIELYIGGEQATDIRWSEDKSYPNECRLYDKTYKRTLMADILILVHVDHQESIRHVIKDVPLANVPIMLKSHLCLLSKDKDKGKDHGECVYDQGGYFVIDGKEKVLISQEKKVLNRFYVTKADASGFVQCTSILRPGFPKTFVMNLKETSMSEGFGVAATREKTRVEVVTKKEREAELKENLILVKFSKMSQPIPLFALFRALGVMSDRQIMSMIHPDMPEDLCDFLRNSIIHAHQWSGVDSKTVFAKIAPLAGHFANDANLMLILKEDLFPNIENEEGEENDLHALLLKKSRYLGMLTRQFVEVMIGQRDETDRDSLMSKRINSSGMILADVFKHIYHDFRIQTTNKVDNNCNNLQIVKWDYDTLKSEIEQERLISLDTLTRSDELKYGLAKSLKGNMDENGVVQDLSRLSYIGTISHLRRVSVPIDGQGLKIRKPHQLGSNQWGYLCPCESPDGPNIGLIKTLACTCEITATMPYRGVELIKAIGRENPAVSRFWKEFDPYEVVGDAVGLFVDDIPIGQVMKPVEFVRAVRRARREIDVFKHVSVTWADLNNIHVFSGPGRCCRPLYYYDDAHKEMRVEFIDVEESNNCYIAMNRVDFDPRVHTHCEIDPMAMFSMYTSTIPFSNSNPVTRNIFSGAQGKQAIGVYATNFNHRIDTSSLVMYYPQRPLVSTKNTPYANLNQLPNGENLIVAIACFTGYNQEDAIILNKSSVERGMFNLTYYHSYLSVEDEAERFGCVSEPQGGIDERGMPIKNHFVDTGSPIVSKIATEVQVHVKGNVDVDIYLQKNRTMVQTDHVERADKTTTGFVDQVVVYKDADQLNHAKIRLRSIRVPELGDKMACYSEDTEVLTHRGWVLWPNLVEGDAVATYDPETGAMSYVCPTKTFQYVYKGDMIDIGDALRVTPNHRVFGEHGDDEVPSFREAQEVTTVRLYSTGKSAWYRGDIVPWNTRIAVKSLWMRFGVVHHNSNLIYFKKTVNRYQLHMLSPQVYEVDGCMAIPSKKEDNFSITGLDAMQSRTFLLYLLQATETTRFEEGDLLCSLTSLNLVCLHAGISSRRCPGGALEIHLESPPLVQFTPRKSVYCGNVYCCEVPPHHLVYVRRGSSSTGVWSGNSRHGQKGVAGMILSSIDMPFTSAGLTPDIIINPHAFPSRMTIGHLLETIVAKKGVEGGYYADGSPFSYNTVDVTTRCGDGDEILYNPRTGEQLNCEIFIGPTYYYRLKHMVADKINSRDKGPVVELTGQPTQGRRNGGGLRIGEMEANALTAHGIASFTKESMMERSDAYTTIVDAQKGSVEVVGAHYPEFVQIPFAFKTFVEELQGLSLNPILRFRKDEMEERDIDELEEVAEPGDDESETDEED